MLNPTHIVAAAPKQVRPPLSPAVDATWRASHFDERRKFVRENLPEIWAIGE